MIDVKTMHDRFLQDFLINGNFSIYLKRKYLLSLQFPENDLSIYFEN